MVKEKWEFTEKRKKNLKKARRAWIEMTAFDRMRKNKW